MEQVLYLMQNNALRKTREMLTVETIMDKAATVQ
jgi:hypothetical protein